MNAYLHYGAGAISWNRRHHMRHAISYSCSWTPCVHVCLLQGGRIRVDGSLMGIDDHSPSLVPEWKRGHFSLLYDASGDKARALFVNHTDKKYIDVKGAQLGSLLSVAGEGRADGACANVKCRIAGALSNSISCNEASRMPYIQHMRNGPLHPPPLPPRRQGEAGVIAPC